MRKRFRYIRAGIAAPDDPICNFRLVAQNCLDGAASCIRVELPDDLVLLKYDCDSYSTTADKRTLNELGYEIRVKMNGRWKTRNDLKPIQPHRIYFAMMKEGKAPVPELGYLTQRQYEKWAKTPRKKED